MNKIKLDKPVIVEGKYDAIKLASVVETEIIKTDGFGVFNNKEKQKYIRKIAEKNGIIVLTDSDSAGSVIRNEINSILPKDKVFHIYSPVTKGKEKRKKIPSKEGILGVEGINADKLRDLFKPFENNEEKGKKVTKTDFYEDGLSGGKDSSEYRKRFCHETDLPASLSSTALLDAVNCIMSYEEYKETIKKIK